MSTVIKALPDRELGHIVQTNDDLYYYVDSTNTFDAGYETMVFMCEKDADEFKTSDWRDLYVEHYSSWDKMEKRHNYLIKHLEEVLK